MTHTVWRLRGSTDKIVECCIVQRISKAYAVTVVLGPETFLDESYPDAPSASRRAMEIRDRLLASGGWTTVAEAAVSLSMQ